MTSPYLFWETGGRFNVKHCLAWTKAHVTRLSWLSFLYNAWKSIELEKMYSYTEMEPNWIYPRVDFVIVLQTDQSRCNNLVCSNSAPLPTFWDIQKSWKWFLTNKVLYPVRNGYKICHSSIWLKSSKTSGQNGFVWLFRHKSCRFARSNKISEDGAWYNTQQQK